MSAVARTGDQARVAVGSLLHTYKARGQSTVPGKLANEEKQAHLEDDDCEQTNKGASAR
jgi:hypothetical protein